MDSRLLSFFIFFTLSVNLVAKTVVISDIDDTIKISHVHSKIDSALNMFRSKVYFKGMPELLALLSEQPDTKIFYLSNAPKWLMGSSHPRFIRASHFPAGKIILRSGLDRSHHKLIHMRQIINQESPDTVILIGDNGESDPQYQSIIKQEFPAIDVHSFIHIAYDMHQGFRSKGAIPHDTTSYVTPVKLLHVLKEQHLVDQERASRLEEKLAQGILQERNTRSRKAHFIPSWLRCKNYTFDAQGASELIQRVARKVNRYCHRRLFRW